jgi:hypothetical protein
MSCYARITRRQWTESLSHGDGSGGSWYSQPVLVYCIQFVTLLSHGDGSGGSWYSQPVLVYCIQFVTFSYDGRGYKQPSDYRFASLPHQVPCLAIGFDSVTPQHNKTRARNKLDHQHV